MINKEEIKELKECLKEIIQNTYAEKKAIKLSNALRYIEQLETDNRQLENNLNQLNTYIFINGIDDTLKTATQISAENQQYYLHQKEVERLKKIIEQLETDKQNSISKSVVEKLLYKEMNGRYKASKSDLCNEKELEYRKGRTDILQEIMKGENDEQKI